MNGIAGCDSSAIAIVGSRWSIELICGAQNAHCISRANSTRLGRGRIRFEALGGTAARCNTCAEVIASSLDRNQVAVAAVILTHARIQIFAILA